MRNILGKVTPTIAAVATVSVLGLGGGAYAAVTHLGKNSVGSYAIKDGGVKQVDLTPWVQRQLTKSPDLSGYAKKSDLSGYAKKSDLSGYAKKSDLSGYAQKSDLSDYAKKSDLDGKADANSVADLQSQVASLQAQVEDLAGQVDSGSFTANKAWAQVAGNAQVTDAKTVVLKVDDGNTSGSSLENPSINIPVNATDHIKFTYTLADGAKAGNGAPRVFIVVGGKYYSTMDNNGAKGYGTPNDDGSFTVDVAPVQMNDAANTPMPSGRVSYAGVVYDNTTAPGTVTVKDLSIGSHEISFE